MSAKNIYHDAVAQALVADGWTITDDPYRLTFASRKLFVDLGAESAVVAAERGTRRIAVEIQSFLGASAVRDLEEAVGQYEIYRTLMAETEPERVLYLAVPSGIYNEIFSERFGQLIVNRLHLRLLVFDEVREGIVQWIE